MKSVSSKGSTHSAAPLDYAAARKRPRRNRMIFALALLLVGSIGVFSAVLYHFTRASASTGSIPTPRRWFSHQLMHDYFVERFVASDGFGGGRMPSTFSVSTDQRLQIGGHTYAIASVELISLDPTAPS